MTIGKVSAKCALIVVTALGSLALGCSTEVQEESASTAEAVTLPAPNEIYLTALHWRRLANASYEETETVALQIFADGRVVFKHCVPWSCAPDRTSTLSPAQMEALKQTIRDEAGAPSAFARRDVCQGDAIDYTHVYVAHPDRSNELNTVAAAATYYPVIRVPTSEAGRAIVRAANSFIRAGIGEETGDFANVSLLIDETGACPW